MAGPGSSGATGQAALNPLGNQEDIWDEKRLEEAMSRLKEMHIQLRNLRTTVPRLLAPLTTKQPPESLFLEFSKSASTAGQEVKEFKKLMSEEATQKVLAQAMKSRSENPNNIKPWRAADHPNWLKRDSPA